MDGDRRLTVEVRGEDTAQGRRYRITIWTPGDGSGLPGTFSNRSRAERVAKVLQAEMGVEWQRENRDLQQLIQQLEDEREETKR